MMKEYDFYEAIYAADTPKTPPFGRIQWKGTNVCIDLWCTCGQHTHYDGDFLYFYACPVCGTKYALGEIVVLIPLTAEQARYVETEHVGFKSGDVDDEE